MDTAPLPPAPRETAYLFERAPQRVYWEVTRACSLACRHCRAAADTRVDPLELTAEEGRALLEQIAAFGDPKPHVVLTGGDPLERADLFGLIESARGLALRVSVSPSATPRLTPAIVEKLARAGVEAISLSIDRASAATHDALRGELGCFDRTMEAAHVAVRAGLLVQVNTLVSAETASDLPAIHALVTSLGVARWSLFFLVSVGRGRVLDPLDAGRAEKILSWLATVPDQPVVTTTEAPHFRRVLLQRKSAALGPTARAGFGIRDGNGVLFVSHTGEVSPSGFLPVSAGNVREVGLLQIYRSSPLFRALRDVSSFEGRCGRCQYNHVCGGSRARAWAATQRVRAEDPLCPYQPVTVP